MSDPPGAPDPPGELDPPDELDVLEAGRRSFERQAWREAFRHLASADQLTPLDVGDLECLAVAAYLAGEDGSCEDAWARAHRAALAGRDPCRAARAAFWLGFTGMLRGEMAPAAGWLSRAERVLDGSVGDCAERGLLLLPAALGRLEGGQVAEAEREFADALAIGQRFGVADLVVLGRLGYGQALVLSGRSAAGFAALDEVMTAVVGGESSPMVAGLAYCAVIEMCHLAFDLRRAREWTAALDRWCEAQPGLVPFRGQCLVHRAEILQQNGAWAEAVDATRLAAEQLSRPPEHPALGDALFRQGELARLRDDLEAAEAAYRQASLHGRDPQPGLALLRMAQGRTDLATSAIERALEEAPHPVARAQLLAAHVEIALAAGDLDAARRSLGDLQGVADRLGTPFARAVSGRTSGAVLLAEGDPGAALGVLRAAWQIWRDLDVPYEAARVRVLVGSACRRLGDEDGAILELEAAALTFRRLGALGDLRALGATAGDPVGTARERPRRLSAREVEVLGLLATGRTNRAIAADLVISEKTVARHVANIFTKLDVSSRAGATAYAYEHGLAARAYTE